MDENYDYYDKIFNINIDDVNETPHVDA